MIVLALNSGSSSLKFGLYEVEANEASPLRTGELESMRGLASLLDAGDDPAPDAIGHRVVHGGPALRDHVVIDDTVLRKIKDATPLAPLHVPASLAVIASARAQFPGLPHVACFDTAFHATMPEVARVLPLPKALRAQGIERYGFHGLSCESIVHQLSRTLSRGLPDRVLIAHLGHGASVTAVRAGRSVDTSMGLTPCGGLIMGTRSGDLDPGTLIYLLRQQGGSANLLEAMLDRQSGLLGISGLSSDMRHLHEAEATNTDARLAIRMFCVAVAKQLAAMATVLGGLDLIAFSGGIGENDADVRAKTCNALEVLGVSLDASANRRGHGAINATASRCAVHVVAAQEDAQIARHTANHLQRTHGSPITANRHLPT